MYYYNHHYITKKGELKYIIVYESSLWGNDAGHCLEKTSFVDLTWKDVKQDWCQKETVSFLSCSVHKWEEGCQDT